MTLMMMILICLLLYLPLRSLQGMASKQFVVCFAWVLLLYVKISYGKILDTITAVNLQGPVDIDISTVCPLNFSLRLEFDSPYDGAIVGESYAVFSLDHGWYAIKWPLLIQFPCSTYRYHLSTEDICALCRRGQGIF